MMAKTLVTVFNRSWWRSPEWQGVRVPPRSLRRVEVCWRACFVLPACLDVVKVEELHAPNDSESVRDRARNLLLTLLPVIRTRDQAIDNLFYVNPSASPELLRWSIAAALFVINTNGTAETGSGGR